MTQVAGTTDTYDLVGRREDFRDAIYMITPEQTPLLSMIGKSEAKNTRHEWQTDTLAAPNQANAQLEGDDYGYADVAQPVRVSNLTQISYKTFMVSGTAEEVKKAGRPGNSEIGRANLKYGKEVMRDIEAAVLARNQASVLGAAATARQSGSLSSWLTSNVSRGATGANGGFNSGTGLTVAATDGTLRTFAETQVQDVMQAAYTAGGKPNVLMMAPTRKRQFSAFTGNLGTNATMPVDGKVTGARSIVAGADFYKSDFGTLKVVPNYIMAAAAVPRVRDVFALDPSMLEIAYLRPFQRQKLAKTGDAEKRAVIAEWTLIVRNEAGNGVVADVQ
ncbi:MAG: DUF5309 domain-containing protein [Proteobacteria bacterium]|nr:DUF5309 domain-containing protein [Pseudomonadota bacterium]